MLIGLISDTHNQVARTYRALRTFQNLGVKAILHLFFGHAHVATDFQQGPTRFVNPGALHRAPKWTYVTLDLATGEIQWHEIKED